MRGTQFVFVRDHFRSTSGLETFLLHDSYSMRLLYVGESWQGSSARSLCEALLVLPGVVIEEIGEDSFLPKRRATPLRLANRLLWPLYRSRFESAIREVLSAFKPDAVVVYKGNAVRHELLEEIRRAGIPSINVFPDFSPHAYGASLRVAMGRYDLVISTKPWHPRHWQAVYGYENVCVCVPHGYDPQLHLWDQVPPADRYDVALCATWRPEYHRLMVEFARTLSDARVSVAIGGNGWHQHRRDFPVHWSFGGPIVGRAYGEFLRSARIVIAPVNREVVIRGVRQPGDEDTTRTYELAAAHCFFLHQRTDFVQTVYNEASEVPMWSDAGALVALVRRWLPDHEGRKAMAICAHARAVPAYSIPERAKLVLALIENLLRKHEHPI